MSDERKLSAQPDKPAEPDGAPGGTRPLVSRRMLLRGATAVVPTILTLHSGAALARSSNLIGAAMDAGPGGDGKYRCLDFDGIQATNNPRMFDLGQPPMAHVTRIDSQVHYYRTDPGQQSGYGMYQHGGSQQVDPRTMCAEGGSFYRQDSRYSYSRDGGGDGYTQVRVKQGVLVSATALSSFSSGINYTDV